MRFKILMDKKSWRLDSTGNLTTQIARQKREKKLSSFSARTWERYVSIDVIRSSTPHTFNSKKKKRIRVTWCQNIYTSPHEIRFQPRDMVSPQIKIKQLVFVSVFIKAFLAFVPKWGCWGQKKPDLVTYSTYFNRVFKREACFQVLKKVNRRSKKDGSTPERFPFSQWWVSSHLRGIKVIKPLKEKFPLSATSFVAKWKGPKADTRLFLFFLSPCFIFLFSTFLLRNAVVWIQWSLLYFLLDR